MKCNSFFPKVHRERIAGPEDCVLPNVGAARISNLLPHYSCSHQQLTPKEWEAIPKAVEVVDKEYKQMNEIKPGILIIRLLSIVFCVRGRRRQV